MLDSALALDRLDAKQIGHPTAGLVVTLASLGRGTEAMAAYRSLVAASHRQFISPEFIARGAIAVGQRDEALPLLKRGMEMHSDLSLLIRFLPGLAPLRNDPRYLEMLDRMALPR